MRIYAHFFDLPRIENKRTREWIDLDRKEHQLLKPAHLQLEQPMRCLSMYEFDAIKRFGDARRDRYQSLQNLVHALHSLKTVTRMALDEKPDLVIFVRPDLRYLDSFAPALDVAVEAQSNSVFIPNWQHWRGGANDRFAIATSHYAAHAYGTRADQMMSYCEHYQEPLHAESLNRFALERAGIDVRFMDVKASRVRADGRQVDERFTRSIFDIAKTKVRFLRRHLRGIA